MRDRWRTGMVVPDGYSRNAHSVTPGVAMPIDTERPMRSDARRNRERVLAAAEDVFADLGLKAQVEEVARRAGVGVGTVCRHFPTKQVLVEAVLEAMYEALLDAAGGAPARPEGGPASEAFFVKRASFQARHRALAEQRATAIDLRMTAQPTRQ